MVDCELYNFSKLGMVYTILRRKTAQKPNPATKPAIPESPNDPSPYRSTSPDRPTGVRADVRRKYRCRCIMWHRDLPKIIYSIFCPFFITHITIPIRAAMNTAIQPNLIVPQVSLNLLYHVFMYLHEIGVKIILIRYLQLYSMLFNTFLPGRNTGQ